MVATDSKDVFLAVTNKDGSISYLRVDSPGASHQIWNWTDPLFGEICETGACRLFEHSEALRYGWFPLALAMELCSPQVF